jgi:hypothetical protein
MIDIYDLAVASYRTSLYLMIGFRAPTQLRNFKPQRHSVPIPVYTFVSELCVMVVRRILQSV